MVTAVRRAPCVSEEGAGDGGLESARVGDASRASRKLASYAFSGHVTRGRTRVAARTLTARALERPAVFATAKEEERVKADIMTVRRRCVSNASKVAEGYVLRDRVSG